MDVLSEAKEKKRGEDNIDISNIPLDSIIGDSLEVLGASMKFQDNTYSIEVLNKIAHRLSSQLGVKYEIITEETAKDLTSKSKTPWNGEQSFFYGDTVYFVGTELSSEMVFHEFAHPLIRAIFTSNAKLANSLYDNLSKTEEGKQLIAEVLESYPEIKDNANLFKEEVIVRALTTLMQTKLSNETTSSGFNNFIRELLYQIKQLLRKTFGQAVTVSSLSEQPH
jgi:hypothetical protein